MLFVTKLVRLLILMIYLNFYVIWLKLINMVFIIQQMKALFLGLNLQKKSLNFQIKMLK